MTTIEPFARAKQTVLAVVPVSEPRQVGPDAVRRQLVDHVGLLEVARDAPVPDLGGLMAWRRGLHGRSSRRRLDWLPRKPHRPEWETRQRCNVLHNANCLEKPES